MGIVFALAEFLSAIVAVVWPLTACFLGFARLFRKDRPGWVRMLFLELRPFYLPAAVIGFLAESMDGGGWWRFFLFGLQLYVYFSARNEDDDDRWKRRREKLASRVQSAGHKLVVVPAPEPTA